MFSINPIEALTVAQHWYVIRTSIERQLLTWYGLFEFVYAHGLSTQTTMMALDEQNVDVIIQVNVELWLVDVVLERKHFIYSTITYCEDSVD